MWYCTLYQFKAFSWAIFSLIKRYSLGIAEAAEVLICWGRSREGGGWKVIWPCGRSHSSSSSFSSLGGGGLQERLSKDLLKQNLRFC